MTVIISLIIISGCLFYLSHVGIISDQTLNRLYLIAGIIVGMSTVITFITQYKQNNSESPKSLEHSGSERANTETLPMSKSSPKVVKLSELPDKQRETVCDLVRKSRQDPADPILRAQALYLLNQALDVAAAQGYPVDIEQTKTAKKLWTMGNQPEAALAAFREAFRCN